MGSPSLLPTHRRRLYSSVAGLGFRADPAIFGFRDA